MQPPLDIATVYADGTLRLVLTGELDIATAPLLDAALSAAEATGATRILVDMAGVPFIDSSGLSSILRAVERSTADGNRLSIVSPAPQAKRLFDLSGARTRLPLIDGP